MKLNKLGMLLAAVLVSSCSQADASKADSGNPAHCIAAFNYGHGVLLQGKNPDMYAALGMSARVVYETLILQKQGVPDRGEGAAKAFTLEHGTDKALMMSLLKECLEKQDGDPQFTTANNNGSLMAIARHVDSLCKGDAACESGAKYRGGH